MAAEEANDQPQMVNIPGIGMFPSGTVPPMVNICPPSPQNNEDPKTGNFKVYVSLDILQTQNCLRKS